MRTHDLNDNVVLLSLHYCHTSASVPKRISVAYLAVSIGLLIASYGYRPTRTPVRQLLLVAEGDNLKWIDPK